MEKTNPLMDKLFSVGAHFGYAPSRRHPSQAPFIFGAKGGAEIFNLEQTASSLENALEFVKSLAVGGKVILFVGGKPEAREQIKRAAERIGQPFVASRWIGGTITNFSEIKKRLALLAELVEKREKGELAKFTKLERLLIDREIMELELMFGGIRDMVKIPDAVFVVDSKKESGAVEEARQMKIPVIAILNSDCDRGAIDYCIPANDASAQTISFVLDEVAKVYENNKNL